MGLSKFIPFIGPIVDIGTSLVNAHEQRDTNAQNIRLQREQRDYETMMSNTAVQRRADDIEKAGGNRALAFTNGSEATTPTVAAARAESPRYDSPNINSAVLVKAQLEQIRAQTAATNASAQGQRINNAINAANLPYGTANAKARADTLQENLRKLSAEIGNLNLFNKIQEVDYDLRELDLKTRERLAPLQITAQQLINDAQAAGIQLTKESALNMLWDIYGKQLDSAEKRAAWKFWSTVPASKWITILRQLAGK